MCDTPVLNNALLPNLWKLVADYGDINDHYVWANLRIFQLPAAALRAALRRDASCQDFVISAGHWDYVLSEAGRLCHSQCMLYMMRIWARETKKYYYKVGFTTDIRARVRRINGDYDSCGRVIIVMAGAVASPAREKAVHAALRIFNVGVAVNRIKRKELYRISPASYDQIKHELSKHCTGQLFETDRYVISDESEETISDERLVEVDAAGRATTDDAGRWYLDQAGEEARYWRLSIFGNMDDIDEDGEKDREP